MNLSFVSFPATDNVMLPGLLYEPEKPTKKVTIWLHGMGDNGIFYKSKIMNELGKAHTDKGIAFLAFNNRGAHSSKRLKLADDTLPEEDRSYQGGTYYEVIADAPKDINGAVTSLKDHGYNEFYLAGISSGANKICNYDATADDTHFKKYILASPGDDTGLFFKDLGEKRYWKASQHAAKLVSTGKPLDIMPKYTGMHPFSAQSSWDILNPNGDYNTFPFYEETNQRLGDKPLFNEYANIKTPTLVIIGQEDEYTAQNGTQEAIDIFLKHTPSQMIKKNGFQLVPGAGHSFTNYEEGFADRITDWLIHG